MPRRPSDAIDVTWRQLFADPLSYANEQLRYPTSEYRKLYDKLSADGKLDSPTGRYFTVKMCGACETLLEEAWAENFLPTIQAVAPVLSTVAMVASYVPVIGTAVAFCLNASVELAKGQGIDAAAIAAFGNSLPGQPVSGMAFNATRSILAGDRIDRIAINALPIAQEYKTAIGAAVNITIALVDGKPITNAILDELYLQLPPKGKQVMALARRVANGENVPNLVLEQAGIAAANAMRETIVKAKALGDNAVRSVIAQTGYQGALDTLPTDLRAATQSAIIVGNAEVIASGSQVLFVPGETSAAKSANDTFALEGQRLIFGKSGGLGTATVPPATWIRNGIVEPIANIRNGSSFAITLSRIDGTTGGYRNETVTCKIDDAWRRGFDVGFAVNAGRDSAALKDATVNRIRNGLNHLNAELGFDVAQEIQIQRTRQRATVTRAEKQTPSNASTYLQFTKGIDTMPVALGRVQGGASTVTLQLEQDQLAAKGRAIAAANPVVQAAREKGAANYKYGFDLGTAVAQFQSENTPVQNAMKLRAMADARYRTAANDPEIARGFDTAQALQFGITKTPAGDISRNPNVALGELVGNGVVDSNLSADSKGIAVQTVITNDSAAREGAAKSIQANMSLLDKILDFFGLL
jgi:hypothetical protein